MRKIESFATEQDVRHRLDQLKSEGVNLSNVTVVSNTDLHEGELRDTDANFKTAEGSGWDKFVSFFTGDDSEHQAIQGFNLSPEDEEKYRNELEKGHILVYVNDNDGVDRHDGRHENRHDAHRNDVGAGAAGVAGAGAAGVAHSNHDRDDEFRHENREAASHRRDDVEHTDNTIDVHEERLNVNKDRVQTGEVTVDKTVESERQEFDVPVEREEVSVERRKVDGERAAGSFDDTLNNDSVRVPVSEERVNVSKENVVAEEVVINKDVVQDKHHVSEEVRREDVEVNENLDNNRRDNDRL